TASSSGNSSTGSSSTGAIRPPTAQLNNAPKTQLLAKFIPSGGGDTLQTSFSYNYNQQNSTGTLQFPLPAGLQNNKEYAMQIWVVPPPPPKNAAIINVNKVDKTLSRTITQYTMNPNGNLEAKQVPIQVTETNNVRTLSGTRQMADADTARIIFSLAF